MSDGAIRYETLVTGPFVENGYLLYREGSDRAILIDPGAEPERWLATLEQRGLGVSAILGTHCHLDHCGAVAPLQDATGAPYLIHPEEESMLSMLPMQCQMFGIDPLPQPRVDGHVEDGVTRRVAGIDVTPIATPGHTPGGTSYHIGGLGPHGTVFTGDSLFAGSIGRTDLPGGDQEQLLRSLAALCQRLPDHTCVCSGHGPETSIGVERTQNPFFRA